MQNTERPLPPRGHGGEFYELEDGTNVFYHVREPISQPKTTIYVLSAIVGINHHREDELITLLYDDKHRVVTIHPRGTGYSQGTRGDSSHFEDFVDSYVQIISDLSDSTSENEKIVLFGEGTATATVLAVASALKQVDGVILVNPPYKGNRVEEKSWSVWDHTTHVAYSVFAQHTPIVDMGGDPDKIKSPQRRKEIRENIQDPLFVRYFSTYVVRQSKKLTNKMLEHAKGAKSPLLMLYGEGNDRATKKGCSEIFSAWAHPNRTFHVIPDSLDSQGTAINGSETLRSWIQSIDSKLVAN